MAKNKLKFVNFKRKRERKTDYNLRLKLLKSGKDRIVIRLTNKRIIVQLVRFKPEGDVVLSSVNSQKLINYGWDLSLNNLPSAYLTGYLFSKKLILKNKQKNNPDYIIDLGLNIIHRGGKIFSVIKGLVDGGLNLNVNEKMFPDEERIFGSHISNYYKKTDENVTQFSKFKNNKNILDIATLVKKVMKKIDEEVTS